MRVASRVAFGAVGFLFGMLACGGEESSPPPANTGTAGASGAAVGQGGGKTAGSGGGSGAAAGNATAGCAKDADCAAIATSPPACATGVCTAGQCSYVARDGDGDGHGTSKCTPLNGEVVKLGDDCDDTNAKVVPGGWDGPADSGKPDGCNDGLDQDCSGVADDGKTPGGRSCVCSPGDVRACAEDSSGKPITFPVKDGAGNPPAPCKRGSQTCLASATWGPCTDAIAPQDETCDKVDNDCDGVIDDDAKDAQAWVFDGDGDGHASNACKPVQACKDTPPTGKPAGEGCAVATCTDCSAKWRPAVGVPADDCDDTSANRRPGNLEICDGIDNDCSGKVDDLPSIGQPCDVAQKATGACKAGGKISCVGTLSGSAVCEPSDPRVGTIITHPGITAFAPNGSGDWDCDGTTLDQYQVGAKTAPLTLPSCGVPLDQVCEKVFGEKGPGCSEGAPYFVVETGPCATPCTPTSCPNPPETCGANVYGLTCKNGPQLGCVSELKMYGKQGCR